MDMSLLKYVLWSSLRCVFKQFTCCNHNMYISSEHLVSLFISEITHQHTLLKNNTYTSAPVGINGKFKVLIEGQFPLYLIPNKAIPCYKNT
jgi:hypothetical protein